MTSSQHTDPNPVYSQQLWYMHAPNFIAELINLGVGNYKQTNKLWKTKPLALYLLGMKPRTTGAGLGLASSM